MKSLTYYEIIKRTYNNVVTIEYEYLNEHNVYIHSIVSPVIKREGRGTEALQEFLQEFEKYNIYLYSSDECRTDKAILDKWYEKNGFVKCNNHLLKYNVTHWKKAQ